LVTTIADGAAGPGPDWPTVLLGAGVSAAALLLYLLTAAHDVVGGDTPEFLIASRTLGVPHAPGFPLLTMLGYLFSWVPIGSIAFRIGLLAVLCSVATVAIVYATVWRLTSMRAPAAAAGLALACTPLFWTWSLQAEAFPLDNVLAALVVFFLVCWHQHADRRRYLLGAAFVFGLAVSNQQTAVFLVPALVYLVWVHRQDLDRQWRTVGYAAVAVAAGFLPYLYVPIAALGHSPTNWDDVQSLSSFVRLFFRGDYGGLTSQGGGAPTGSNVAVRTLYLARGFGLVVGVLSLLGAVHAYRTVRWYFWFVVLGVTVTGVGFLLFSDVDPTNDIGLYVLERFFLLPLVVAAPLVALSVVWLGELVVSRRPSLSLQRASAAIAAIVVAASLVVVGVNYSAVNVSNDHVTGNYARDVIEGLKPHTILFATGDEGDTAELYLTSVAGIRPDVTVLIAAELGTPWYAQVLRQNGQIHVPAKVSTLSIIRANPGRPVAFTGPAPDSSLDGTYYLYPDGLVSVLEKVGHPILVTRDEADNEAQLARIHVPDYRTIKQVSAEPVILDHYANIPYRIGQAYALAGQKAQAIAWYRKAMAMDPSLPLAATAIRKLGGTP
jgi:hypothetical protein